MCIERLDKHTYIVDVAPCDVKNFISTYIIQKDKTAIIEPGPPCSIKNLLLNLRKLDIDPAKVDYVLVTHIHLDHAGGSGTLLQRFLPNARLVVHPRGVRHMVNPEKLWVMAKKALGKVAEMYGAPNPVPEHKIVEAYDGMIIDLGGGVRLKVLETLGHASHHLSFYEPSSGKMFSGDAAGIYIGHLDAIVPTTPEPLYLDAALESIQRMKDVHPRFLCYTHFGCVGNALEKLEAYASQLKLWEEIVRECLLEGEGLEAIQKRIIAEDSYVGKTASFMSSHPIMGRGMLLQNIQGFVGYVKRNMKKNG